MNEELELINCPECGLPAEIIDRVMLRSTDGLVEHVKTRCVTGPWFLVPADHVSRDGALTAPERSGVVSG